MEEIIEQFREWLRVISRSAGEALDVVQHIAPALRTGAAGLGALLEMFVVTGLFVPGDTVVLIAAAAVSDPIEGIALGVTIALGALLGETASYGIGYWIGTSTRGARLRKRTGERRISSAQRLILRWGGAAILASRFVPVLRTVMPFAVGANGFPFRQFMAWAIPASFTWSAVFVPIYALAAAPLREGDDSLLLTLGPVALGLLVFAAAGLVQFFVERRIRNADAPPLPLVPSESDPVEEIS